MQALKATTRAKRPEFLVVLAAVDVDGEPPAVRLEGDFTESRIHLNYPDGITRTIEVSQTNLRLAGE